MEGVIMPESDRINSIMYKIQKSAALSAEELTDLQSHIDELEHRSLAAHGDTVQSSHFHPSAALEIGGGRETAQRR
jgi:hypothetical protein